MRLLVADELLRGGKIGQTAFTHAFIYALEARNIIMDKLSRASGRLVRVVQIRDLTGFWPSTQAIAFGKIMVQLSQDNYPETMCACRQQLRRACMLIHSLRAAY